MAWSGVDKRSRKDRTVLGPLNEFYKPPAGGSVRIEGRETILVPLNNILTTVSLNNTGRLKKSSLQDIKDSSQGSYHRQLQPLTT